MGLFRRIRLALDRSTARRFERDAQRSLDRATDGSKAKSNLRGIRDAFLGFFSAELVLRAFGAIRNFLAGSIRQFREAEQVWNRARGTVQGLGGDFDKLLPLIQATAEELQKNTPFGDEDFIAAFQSIALISGDVAGALENVELAFDLAAGGGIELKTAAELVGKVMAGEVGTLKRYGIVVQEGADAIEVMREQFGGLARNEANSVDGVLRQLINRWDDFKQAIGEAMGGGEQAKETIRELTELLVALQPIAVATVQILGVLFGWLVKLGRVIVESPEAQGLVTLFKMMGFEAGEATEEVKDLTEAMEELERLRKRGGGGGSIAPMVSLGLEFEPTDGPRGPTKLDDSLDVFQGDRIVDMARANAEIYDELLAGAMDRFRDLEVFAHSAAFGIMDAFHDAFALIGDDTADLGDMVETVFKGMAKATLNAIADVAGAKARENIARALEAMGRGFLGEPGAFAAAGKFFAAAAAWSALGGALAGVGSAVGGGGSSASASGTGDGRTSFRDGEEATTEIHIFLDPLDPDGAPSQDFVWQAWNRAQERHGRKTRTTIHRRTG